MCRQHCHGNDCLQVLLPMAMPGNVWIWNRLLPQVRLLWLPRHQLEEKIIIFITLVKISNNNNNNNTALNANSHSVYPCTVHHTT